ncbi:hypothetical protein CVT26_015880 [Gymnopilus dilepis]|uniref:F-box domain-containing protein n=1 Tax=Gymnopilus dilepis TaxID=231916 RepID=A0A409XYA4_9AGAR|nr:hypothetical protein CVT26_015880 [Gymnopilus dilepis]
MAYHAVSAGFTAAPSSYDAAMMPSYQRSKSYNWAYSNGRLFLRQRSNFDKIHDASSSKFDDSEESVDGETVTVSFDTTTYSNASIVRQGVDGSLQMMTKLPVDVLYEVFSHLHPMDVLSLSRTTKSLRSILLARHARGVWRSSLATVRALPPCPPDLTEAQYASLAFDNWCQSCLAANVEKILWECRVRYCKACIKKFFIQEDELDLWIPEEVFIEKPDTVFPLAYVLQTPSQSFSLDWTSVLNLAVDLLLYPERTNGRMKPVYFLPTARQYLEELQEIAKTQDNQALARWSEEKKRLQSMRLAHATLCVYWDTHWAYRRSRPVPSRLFETVILVVLALVLAFLWREKLASMAPSEIL